MFTEVLKTRLCVCNKVKKKLFIDICSSEVVCKN